MSIESSTDLDGLTEAGRVTRETLDALVAHTPPGMSTADLDAIAAEALGREGARSAPALVYGFPGTVLISVNDEIVHGIPGRCRLREGDLVSLDVTIEKDGSVADAARSVIVGSGAARRQGFAVVRGLCGHGVGRTIHEPPEVPNEYDPSQRDVLTEGLVLTIEPMISAGSARAVPSRDGWTLRTSDGSLAAHCEHTLVITRGEPLILAA